MTHLNLSDGRSVVTNAAPDEIPSVVFGGDSDAPRVFLLLGSGTLVNVDHVVSIETS